MASGRLTALHWTAPCPEYMAGTCWTQCVIENIIKKEKEKGHEIAGSICKDLGGRYIWNYHRINKNIDIHIKLALIFIKK